MIEVTIEYINDVIASIPVAEQKIEQLRKEFPAMDFSSPFISIFDVPEHVFDHFLNTSFCRRIVFDKHFITAAFEIEDIDVSIYLNIARTNELFDKYIRTKLWANHV